MDVAVDWYLAVPLLFTVLAAILASLFVKLRSSDGAAAEEAAAAAAKAREAEARAGGEQLQEGSSGLQPPQSPAQEQEDVPEAGRRSPAGEIGAGDQQQQQEQEAQAEALRDAEAPAQARTAEAEQPTHPPEGKTPRQAAAAAAVEVDEEQEEEEEEEDEEEEEEEEESKEEEQESENEKLVVKEPETEDGSLFEDDGRSVTGHIGSSVDEQFSFKYSPGKLRGNQYKTMMTKEELEEEQRVQREQLSAIFNLMKEKKETFGDMSETDIKDQLKLYDM